MIRKFCRWFLGISPAPTNEELDRRFGFTPIPLKEAMIIAISNLPCLKVGDMVVIEIAQEKPAVSVAPKSPYVWRSTEEFDR